MQCFHGQQARKSRSSLHGSRQYYPYLLNSTNSSRVINSRYVKIYGDRRDAHFRGVEIKSFGLLAVTDAASKIGRLSCRSSALAVMGDARGQKRHKTYFTPLASHG